jgi:hypothetical protein
VSNEGSESVGMDVVGHENWVKKPQSERERETRELVVSASPTGAARSLKESGWGSRRARAQRRGMKVFTIRSVRFRFIV